MSARRYCHLLASIGIVIGCTVSISCYPMDVPVDRSSLTTDDSSTIDSPDLVLRAEASIGTPTNGQGDLSSMTTGVTAGKALIRQIAARQLSVDIREEQDREWGSFRTAFPYHIQVLAASTPYQDGTRTLIVSEPPPHAVVSELQALAPNELATVEVKTHTVGHDGWVKDLVFNLPQGMSDEDVQLVVGKLSEYLFATKYKAYALPLPIDPALVVTKYPLDLAVGAENLNRWVVNGKGSEQPGGPLRTFEEMAAKPGVYLMDGAGLIAWVIGAEARLDDRRNDIRRFALDSDIIVGAIKASNGAVVVVARERIVPLHVMPPLRAEMVVLVASTNKNQLSQSYERTSLFAGKMADSWDWAPAYLSPELINTEYGSLMNIADQMLKSWTQHGQVRYQNFHYPDPVRFPFDRALIDELQARSLLFNWNTSGVGSVVELGPLQLYAINRTGALPVIYRPDDEQGEPDEIQGNVDAVKQAEEVGYQFFATQSDPILVRVVQYTALYQCFRSFGIRAQAPVEATVGTTATLIRERLKSVLAAVATASDEKVHTVAQAEVEAQLRNMKRGDFRHRLESWLLYGLGPQRLIENVEVDLDRVRSAVAAFYREHEEPGLQLVVELWPVSRDEDENRTIKLPAGATQATVDAAHDLIEFLYKQTLLLNIWANLTQVQTEFSAAQGDGGARWLRTQTVVLSRPFRGAVTSEGGTNADAKVTTFKADSGLQRGKVKLLDDGTILFNPADLGRLPQLSRLAAREKSSPQLDILFSEQMALNAFRPDDQRTILALGDRPIGGAMRGFKPEDHLPQRAVGGSPPRLPPPPGSRPPAEPPSGERPPAQPAGSAGRGAPEAAPFFAAASRGLYLEKEGPIVRIFRRTAKGNEVAEAWNADGLAFAISAEMQNTGRRTDRGPIELKFGSGFTESDVASALKTLRVQAERLPRSRSVIVYRQLRPGAEARLAERVVQARPQTFVVQALDGGNVRIAGRVEVTTQAPTSIAMSLEITLRKGDSQVTLDGVNSTVQSTTQRVASRDDISVRTLGGELYRDILDYSGRGRASDAEIMIEDIGDFYIVLEVEPELPLVNMPEAIRATMLALRTKENSHARASGIAQ